MAKVDLFPDFRAFFEWLIFEKVKAAPAKFSCYPEEAPPTGDPALSQHRQIPRRRSLLGMTAARFGRSGTL
jgi:hypothetical protein